MLPTGFSPPTRSSRRSRRPRSSASGTSVASSRRWRIRVFRTAAPAFLQSELAKPALFAAMVLIGAAFALRALPPSAQLPASRPCWRCWRHRRRTPSRTSRNRSGRAGAIFRHRRRAGTLAGRRDPAPAVAPPLHLEDGSGRGWRGGRGLLPVACWALGAPGAGGPTVSRGQPPFAPVEPRRRPGALSRTRSDGRAPVCYRRATSRCCTRGACSKASRITYDERADEIRAEGPLARTPDPQGWRARWRVSAAISPWTWPRG